jgi:hypothetical protein
MGKVNSLEVVLQSLQLNYAVGSMEKVMPREPVLGNLQLN